MPNTLILLLFLGALWGSSFFAIKISVQDLDPLTVASGRLIIASIILYIYFKFKKLVFKPTFRIIILIIIIGFLGNFIPFFLISWSETIIQSNTAGLLMSVAPIFVVILAHFLTKDDKFSFEKIFAIIIGSIGVLFIFGNESIADLYKIKYSDFIPKLAVILAVLGYAISSVIAYNLKKIDIITLTTYVTIAAALISLPFMVFVEFNNISNFNIRSIFALIYLGVFPTALAFLIRFHLILKAGPTYLSYVSYIIPGFAIFWGYIFLGEKIHYNDLIGLFFIFIGIYLTQKNFNERNNSQ